MSGYADSAARRHAYDSSIKLPFDTNSRQNYRIRLQDLAAAIFCNLILRRHLKYVHYLEAETLIMRPRHCL